MKNHLLHWQLISLISNRTTLLSKYFHLNLIGCLYRGSCYSSCHILCRLVSSFYLFILTCVSPLFKDCHFYNALHGVSSTLIHRHYRITALQFEVKWSRLSGSELLCLSAVDNNHSNRAPDVRSKLRGVLLLSFIIVTSPRVGGCQLRDLRRNRGKGRRKCRCWRGIQV